MTRAMDADDPNSYMMKMCKEGYFGPVCSLCTLHNAPPGQDRYGRTGTLECKPCRQALHYMPARFNTAAHVAAALLPCSWRVLTHLSSSFRDDFAMILSVRLCH